MIVLPKTQQAELELEDLSKLRFSMEVDILDVEYEAARQQGKRETTEKLYAYIEGRHGEGGCNTGGCQWLEEMEAGDLLWQYYQLT